MKEREAAELYQALQEIRNRTVIVEGKKDERVLCSLGFRKVVSLKGKDIPTFAESIRERAVILTDFDSEGERLAKRLSLFLRCDLETRRKIRKLSLKLGLVTIESFRKLRGDVHEQAGSVEFEVHHSRPLRGERGGRKTRCNRRDFRPDRRTPRS